jgi:hypothetical protein
MAIVRTEVRKEVRSWLSSAHCIQKHPAERSSCGHSFQVIRRVFYFSVVFTLAALTVFGFVKGKFTGVSR